MEELKEGWRLENLEENLEVILDYRGKTPQKSEKGRVTLSAKSVKMGYIDYSNIYYVSEETYSKFMTRGLPKKGDILLTTEAPLGCVAELKDDSVCLAQRLITLRGKKEKLNNKYLLYYLQSPRGQYELLSKATGTTVQGIKRTEFSKVKILMPSLEKQNKIASILSSLDEKIELNRKINQNLEEICQNYFVEIFIKNSNKNCSIGQISDLGNIVSGATPSKKNQKYYTNFGIPWITPKDLSKISNKFISRGNLDITELGFKNSSVRLLPKGSVLFSSRAPIGYIAICSNDVTTNQGFKSIVPFKNIGTEFVYYFLKNNVQFLESRASGSTFKEISTTIMATTPAIIPKEDPLKVFKKICINIFEKQYIIEKETEKLIELRDYLLPKLMNGEIDVSNLKISKILNSDKFN